MKCLNLLLTVVGELFLFKDKIDNYMDKII